MTITEQAIREVAKRAERGDVQEWREFWASVIQKHRCVCHNKEKPIRVLQAGGRRCPVHVNEVDAHVSLDAQSVALNALIEKGWNPQMWYCPVRKLFGFTLRNNVFGEEVECKSKKRELAEGTAVMLAALASQGER